MSEGQNPYESQGQAYQGPSRGNWNRDRGNGSQGSSSYSGGSSGGSSYGSGSSYSRGSGGGNYSSGSSGGYNNNRGGGYNRDGGGFRGGNSGNGKPAFQPRQYTEEDIKNARYPKTVVISGNEHINDQIALTIGELARAFHEKDFVIRTGGLNGVDDVAERAVPRAELHLPFKGFNRKESESQYTSEICTELARRQQPDLDTMQKVPKAILAKNPRLVFGRFLNSPAQLVIVWSEDGCEHPNEVTGRSGNAGHIVKLAFAAGIRVINIQRPDGKQRALSYLESLNVQEPTQQTQQPTGYQPTAPAGNPSGNPAGQQGGSYGGNQYNGNSGGGSEPSFASY